MSRLTLRLPATLHQQLVNLAKTEGISLNQYIVYALTRQVSEAYTVSNISDGEIKQQYQSFSQLIQELGEWDDQQIDDILAEREKVPLQPDLNPEIMISLKNKIRNQVK